MFKLKRFRGLLSVVLVMTGLGGVAFADDPVDVVRLISVNGVSGLAHPESIDVHPGDVIALSADVLRFGGECTVADGCSLNRDIEEFLWSADDAADDVCDPVDAARGCLSTSKFQANDFGVNFYFPKDIAAIKITVKSKSNPDAADTITLNNPDFQTAPPVEIPVVTQPEEYPPEATFTEDSALSGLGRWVYVEGVRYWVPYSYHDNWEPYCHGNWTWVDAPTGVTFDEGQHGWTWVSHDPWGWYTDHYGVWRHHRLYGWVWLPFEKRHYRPHTVTWFNGEGYSGWWPYYAAYRAGYRHNERHGFDDGYWAGVNAHTLYGNFESGYYPGFVVVRHNQFVVADIDSVKLRHRDAYEAWHGAGDNRSYRHFPGPATIALRDSRGWLQTRVVTPILVTTLKDYKFHGGAQLIAPVRAQPVPPEYKDRYKAFREIRVLNKVPPVGAIVKPPASPGDKPIVVHPTGNSRGIVIPPRIVDQSGKSVPAPPRTSRPAIPNKENHPVYRPEPPAPKPPTPPGPPPKPIRPIPGHPGHPPVQPPRPPHPPVEPPKPPHPPVEPPKPPHPPVEPPKPPHPPVEPPKPPHPPVEPPKPPHPPQPPVQPPHPPQPPVQPPHPPQPPVQPPHPPQPPVQPPKPPQPPVQPPHPPQPPVQPPHPPQPPVQPPHPPQPPVQPPHPPQPPVQPPHPPQPPVQPPHPPQPPVQPPHPPQPPVQPPKPPAPPVQPPKPPAPPVQPPRPPAPPVQPPRPPAPPVQPPKPPTPPVHPPNPPHKPGGH